MTPDQELAIVTAAIAAIEKIIETVRSAKSGAVAPDVALAAVTKLHDELAANNATADQELHQRFDLEPIK